MSEVPLYTTQVLSGVIMQKAFHLDANRRGAGGMCPLFAPQQGVNLSQYQSKNNSFEEMCSGSEEGSYLRLIDLCTT